MNGIFGRVAMAFSPRILAAATLTATLAGCVLDETTQSTSNGTSSAGTAQVSSLASRAVTPISTEDAVRFLDQATFGATDDAIASVKRLGYEGYLDDQFGRRATRLPTPDPIYGDFGVICRDRYVGADGGLDAERVLVGAVREPR